MGIVAVIMGVLGLIVAVLPFISPWLAFISWLAWLFIILAIVFGIIAVVKKKKVPGFIGLGLAVLSIVLYFVAGSVAMSSAEDAVQDLNALGGLQMVDPNMAMDPAAQQQLQQAMQGLGQAMQQLPAQPAPPPAQ